MTSPANQQNPATNTSATTAPSYASAAGAPQKPAQTQTQPAVAASGSQPSVAAPTASPAQNAKQASTSPVNGKPAVSSAVPAVARGSAVPNGAHSRQSSVTMAANGPNSFAPNGGPAASAVKSGIQFGFNSPVPGHSSPQTGNAAPIPIPGGGNPRISSPAHSPSPIPQPSASGGRPPSSLQQHGGQMTFGSLGSDGERHMRQGSVPPAMGGQPGTHFRRESNNSIQSEGPGNRGSFTPQGGRGRGGYHPHNNNYNNHQMGYPPNPNQFRPGGQGRGMPPAFQPQGPRFPNSPQAAHRSPAMGASIPNTPNMTASPMVPPMPMQGAPAYQYAPPMQGQPQVQFPPIFIPKKASWKPSKKNKFKNKPRRDEGNGLVQQQQQPPPARPDAARDQGHASASNPVSFAHRQNWRSERDSTGSDLSTQQQQQQQQASAAEPPRHGAEKSPEQQPEVSDAASADSATAASATAATAAPFFPTQLDLAPGNYEQLLLTLKNQGYGYPPPQQQLDQYGRPFAYSMPYMPQANSPGYNQPFVPQPYHQASHSMSRTPSQPERPASANQHGPPVAVGSTNKQPAGGAAAKPRKSAAIVIKTESGQVVDTSSFKVAPASPAPSSQHARTPPIASANPTPPPKPSTPAHGRTDSHATQKTAKEIQDELKEKIKQATQPKEAAAADAKPKAAEESAKAAEPAESEKEPAKNDGPPSEDEMERIIREMEEEDARREKQEAEHRAKADAEKAAAKAKAEEDRKANAADEDRKLREQEREMERLEEEKERKRAEAESSGKTVSMADALAGKAGVDDVADKLSGMKIGDKAAGDAAKSGATTAEKRGPKPAALNLAPLNTKPVEPPQPSAALQSLKSARFLQVMEQDIYPAGIKSPNPALNAAVANKGKTFKYDSNFLLQFRGVFTEQPSLEFHQQVKSLIGDGDGGRSGSRAQTPGSSRQGSRGAGGGFTMGAFNAPAGRTLPRGTTSQQRFEEASRAGANPMPGFQRPGGFPLPTMSRTPSMGPNSPRQSSRSTRGSRRGDHGGAKEAQAAKTMPLTAGQELKPITVSASGWKPTSIGRGAAGAPASKDGLLDPEMVQRKVKAALNKMTPENFERISEQILTIAHQSKEESDGRTLRQVIQLTFEKATDEAHWASMYAKFCKKMLETMSPEIQDERIKDKNGNTVSGGNLFRKYLLNRCQEEFERGWSINLPETDESNKKQGEAAMLSDEYYAAAAAKRRGLGLVQFIGELYKLGMLTERIMIECVRKLVDYKGVPDEAEIESLSKLLRTIGQNLDMSEKGRPMMEAFFERIQHMMDLPELPSRLKFMLMDVVDLRKANWKSKETNKGPKTLEEIRAEAEAAAAAKAQENARTNQRGGGGRLPAGRGDARNFSGGHNHQPSNQVGMDDLRRLKGSANRSSSGNVTLGPTSMFSSRSNSGRRLGPGGSLGRTGDDSGPSSRSGTPLNRENSSHSNAFSLLANMETENPASPPSTAAVPAKAADKKEGE